MQEYTFAEYNYAGVHFCGVYFNMQLPKSVIVARRV